MSSLKRALRNRWRLLLAWMALIAFAAIVSFERHCRGGDDWICHVRETGLRGILSLVAGGAALLLLVRLLPKLFYKPTPGSFKDFPAEFEGKVVEIEGRVARVLEDHVFE